MVLRNPPNPKELYYWIATGRLRSTAGKRWLNYQQKKYFIGFKKSLQASLYYCLQSTLIVILFTQIFSHFPFPEDGKVIEIPIVEWSKISLSQNKQVFFIHGIVKGDTNESFGLKLAQKINYPVTVINNGSSCLKKSSSCRKFGDIAKAFLNRFGNKFTGRGNEPIIGSLKQQLRIALNNPQYQEIIAISHSEGGLILDAAIQDLSIDSRLPIDKLKVVLMGSPLHKAKLAALKQKVGELQIFSNSLDPVICLQKNIWYWSSWLGKDPQVKYCLQNSDRNQHLDTAYLDYFENYTNLAK